MKKISYLAFLIAFAIVFACGNKNKDLECSDEETEVIDSDEVLVDNSDNSDENDKRNVEFKRALAEQSIVKARQDVTLAKEAIHRRLKTPGYSFKTTGDEEMDNYLRRQEREELERTERQLNSAIAGLLENYEKGYYTLVIQQADAIASKRISLE